MRFHLGKKKWFRESFHFKLGFIYGKHMTGKSFCIVQLGRIGDLILTTPFFEAIKKDNPNHQISVFCGRNNYHFASNYKLIDKCFVYWKKPFLLIKLIRDLRKEKFDYWIDPKDHYSSESHFFAKISNASLKIGFNTHKKKSFDLAIPSAKENYNIHVIERNLKTLELAGICSNIKSPKLYLKQESEKKLIRFLEKKSIANYIHINISASKKSRYWPSEKWIELESKVSEYRTTLFSCDPKDISLLTEIIKKCKDAYHYPTHSLEDLYSLINKANCVISPDTAVIHIASAFNKKIIGLYANLPWNFKKFSPYSSSYVILINKNSDVDITDITVSAVYKALEKII